MEGQNDALADHGRTRSYKTYSELTKKDLIKQRKKSGYKTLKS